MQPVHPWVTLVIAALAVAAGVVIGYAVVPPRPSSEGGGVAPATLSITAAGSLAPIFPSIAQAYANVTTGVAAPPAAEQFQGSLAALSAVSVLHEPFDVAASADYRLIPQLLEGSGSTGGPYATWEIVFGSTPEVLAYDPSVTALAGINSTNWASRLTAAGVVLGVANQSTDPNGYNGIFVLELEGLLQSGSTSAVYSHFYTTPVGGLAEPNPATTRVEPETQAAALLTSHAISAFIVYRSYAMSQGLSFVSFDPKVGLGSLNPSDIAFDQNASTTILAASGPELVRGAPVLFAATVPTTAPDPSVGVGFLDFLDSPVGSSLLAAHGFTPVFPAYSIATGSSLPAPLVPVATPLPADLVALLPVSPG